MKTEVEARSYIHNQSLAADGQQNALTPSFAIVGGGPVTTQYDIGWAPDLVWPFWRREKGLFLLGIKLQIVHPTM